ncbi:MAG: hypothetical protein JWO12_2429 [Frankiales bacterium]|jgi:putative membrane protein|nr:hypothetical protein [Frankiales bacterium]
MMGWNNGHLNVGWGVVMLIGMLAFWVLIAVLVARGVQARRPFAQLGATHGEPTSGAKRILAERLARGEIEPQDYQARLAALTQPG